MSFIPKNSAPASLPTFAASPPPRGVDDRVESQEKLHCSAIDDPNVVSEQVLTQIAKKYVVRSAALRVRQLPNHYPLGRHAKITYLHPIDVGTLDSAHILA